MKKPKQTAVSEPEPDTALSPDPAPAVVAGQRAEQETEEMAKDANLRFIAPVSVTNSFQTVVTGSPYIGPSIKTNGQYNPWAALGLQFETKKGSVTSGTGAVDIKLQESNDNTNWTDIVGGAITTIPLTTTASGQKPVIPFTTSATIYQRAIVTVTGTGGTVDVAGGIGTGVFPKASYPVNQGV